MLTDIHAGITSLVRFNRKGLTVVEVLVTIVMLGILGAFVFAKYGEVKEKAYIDAMMNDLRNYTLLAEQYYSDEGTYASPAQLLDEGYGYEFSQDVSQDSLDLKSAGFYLRVQHERTDIKCLIEYGLQAEADNKIKCPGATEVSGDDEDNLSPDAEWCAYYEDDDDGCAESSGDLSGDVEVSGDGTPEFDGTKRTRFAVGRTLVFDASASTDPDGEILSYRWDFNGDGNIDATGVTTTHAFSVAGLHDVVLTVVDDSGAEGNLPDQLEAEENENIPVAAFDAFPSEPQVGEEVTFDPSASTDADLPDDSLAFQWSFGDGTTSTDSLGTHSYSADGEYEVRLLVVDLAGQKDEAVDTVTARSDYTLVSFWDPCESWQQNSLVDTEGNLSSLDFDYAAGPDFGDPSRWNDGSPGGYILNENPDSTYLLNTSIDQSSGEWTVIMAIKPDATQGFRSHFFYTRWAEDKRSDFRFRMVDTPTEIEFAPDVDIEGDPANFTFLDGSSGYRSITSNGPPADQWSALAVQVTPLSGDTIAVRLYVDGSEIASERILGNVNGDGADLQIRPRTSFWANAYATAEDLKDGQPVHGEGGGIMYLEGAVPASVLSDRSAQLVNNNCSPSETTRPPDAAFTWEGGEVDVPVTFDASETSDPDGDAITLYEWDFDGDGNVDASADTDVIEYTYSTLGTYNVTLTVTESNGATDSVTEDVEVVSLTLAADWDPCHAWGHSAWVDGVGGYNGGIRNYEDGWGHRVDPPAAIDVYANSWGSTFPTNIALDRTAQEWTMILTYLPTSGDMDGNWRQIVNGGPVTPTVKGSDIYMEGYHPHNLTPGEWATVAIVRDTADDVVNLYQDGTLLGQHSTTESLTWNNTVNFFGHGDNTRTLSGAGGRIVYYERALPRGVLAQRHDELLASECELTIPPNAVINTSADTTDHVAGDEVLFDGTESTDADGTIEAYEWTLTGDGDVVAESGGPTMTETLNDAGRYLIQLAVTDNAMLTDYTWKVFYVSGPPTAEARVWPQNGSTDDTYEFDGSWSTDPTGGKLTYIWDFGDGSAPDTVGPAYPGFYTPASHNYASDAQYTAQLIAENEDDPPLADTATVTVNVGVSPPATFIEARPGYKHVDEPITLDGSDSHDVDGSIASWRWDFGDGSPLGSDADSTTHTYSSDGEVTATLTVTDDDGNEANDSVTFTVYDSTAAAGNPPVADLDVIPNHEGTYVQGEAIAASGTGSTDPDGDNIDLYEFAWESGPTTSGPRGRSHATYSSAGTYDVTLTVTDETGLRDDSTVTISVESNQAPTADLRAWRSEWNAEVSEVEQGESVDFNWGNSTDPEGALSYAVLSFPKENPYTGEITTYTDTLYPSDNFMHATNIDATGSYTADITVYDEAGLSDTDDATWSVISDGERPVADFTYSPHSPAIDENVLFNGGASYDPDGSIVSYEWNLGGLSDTGETVQTSFNQATTYTVVLTVTDNDGNTDSKTKYVSVATSTNQGPVADFNYWWPGDYVEVGEGVGFDGSLSYDPDGTITSYEWDFGNGLTDSRESTAMSYSSDGTYEVTLTVTDDAGKEGSARTSITVGDGNSTNQLPSASFSYNPNSPAPGESAGFDASESSDPDGTITSYEWDFGDSGNSTGVTPNHTYSSAGSYTVTLTVTDDDGGQASTSRSISVGDGASNEDPTASFTHSPSSPNAGDAVSFDGTGSSDPDGTIESYFWTFGDGNGQSGSTPSHTYESSGDYTVTLTVTDDDGATDSERKTVSVGGGSAPTARFSITPNPSEVGGTVTFDASASSDDGTISSYEWDFGDLNSGTGETTTHTFSAAGEYSVQLTVTDDEALTDSETKTATVVVGVASMQTTITPDATVKAGPIIGPDTIYFDVDLFTSGGDEITECRTIYSRVWNPDGVQSSGTGITGSCGTYRLIFNTTYDDGVIHPIFTPSYSSIADTVDIQLIAH